MSSREPYAARVMGFYPADPAACGRLVDECLAQAASGAARAGGLAPIVAGIVPHAGWVYSGPTAARTVEAIHGQQPPPDTFLLFGADHRGALSRGGLDPRGSWITPLGEAAIDEELAERLLASIPDLLQAAPHAHRQEHSLEVQVPFLQRLFPAARILPLMVPPFEGAAVLGEKVRQVVAGYGRRVVALGSTDLTHYGPAYDFTPAGPGQDPVTWTREVNDRRMIEVMERVAAEEAVPEFRESLNACGPGAIAATLAYARAAGATGGHLLHHVTSAEVRPTAGKQNFVGYAAMVFEAA